MNVIIERITTVFLTLMSLLGVIFGDSFCEGKFPIIEAETKDESLVRVMTFNIRTANVGITPREKREDIVIAQIEECIPDSLGVQEASNDWMETLSARLTQYAWVGTGRDGDGNGEYSAIFYLKDKYHLIDSGTFWLSETPDAVSYGWGAVCRRICTWAVLENKMTGESYVHVNSHFDHISERARKNSASLIIKFIEDKFADTAVVFTADMNAKEGSEAYLTMTQTLSDAKYISPDSKYYGTFHNRFPALNAENYIDFILLNDDLTPRTFRTVTAGIDGRYVSDHFPLYADIEISGGQ